MKAMVLCSGGVDSTTCLGMAVDKYGAENVIALSIYYGQKHTKEIECAKKSNTALSSGAFITGFGKNISVQRLFPAFTFR